MTDKKRCSLKEKESNSEEEGSYIQTFTYPYVVIKFDKRPNVGVIYDVDVFDNID